MTVFGVFLGVNSPRDDINFSKSNTNLFYDLWHAMFKCSLRLCCYINTSGDLKKSKMAPMFFNTIFNLRCTCFIYIVLINLIAVPLCSQFVIAEQRDPVRIHHVHATPQVRNVSLKHYDLREITTFCCLPVEPMGSICHFWLLSSCRRGFRSLFYLLLLLFLTPFGRYVYV